MGTARLFWIVIITVTTLTGWIARLRARRRVKKALDKPVSDVELTSLSLWMKVEDADERNRESKTS
jgi:hypothetical protein